MKRVNELTVGDPLEDKTKIGPLNSEAHMKKVLGYIELAKQEGGTILLGGEAVQVEGRCAKGWFIAPTIIEGAGCLHAQRSGQAQYAIACCRPLCGR